MVTEALRKDVEEKETEAINEYDSDGGQNQISIL